MKVLNKGVKVLQEISSFNGDTFKLEQLKDKVKNKYPNEFTDKYIEDYVDHMLYRGYLWEDIRGYVYD